MKTCILCNNSAGWFPKKSYSGYLCKDCLSLIPLNVCLSTADTDFLKGVTEKAKERKERFKCTAFYGTLFIDGVHNMFCISKRQSDRRQQGRCSSRNKVVDMISTTKSDRRQSKGEPLSFGDVYYITELKEVGLFCTNVRNIGSRVPKIICDVKIRVKTDETFTEYVIANNEPCSFKTVKDGVEWNEPAKLSMFRSLFNQMIENEVCGAWERLEEARAMEKALSQIPRSERWARGIFFFGEDEEITTEALKKRRDMLVKLFHPDVDSAFASNEIMVLINEAYQSLKK